MARQNGHEQTAIETLDLDGHLWPDGDDESRHAADAVLGDQRMKERERQTV
jgi:hypothetical protein